MLLTAEHLLNYQRCQRRAFLDQRGDLAFRSPPSDFLRKLLEDSALHRREKLSDLTWQSPVYAKGDWQAGAAATQALMGQGVERIFQGVLIVPPEEPEDMALAGIVDLLEKRPGRSDFGDWVYVPIEVKLGKRPKLEYQIVAAFYTQLLAGFQGAWPEEAWLVLREAGLYEVDLWQRVPQMQTVLAGLQETLRASEVPEVFISRSRCSLCHWYGHCYEVAHETNHLSLLPGVTPTRYAALQELGLTSVESLATATPKSLEGIPGFGEMNAHRLIRQARATVLGQAIPYQTITPAQVPTAPVELYFDIEAEPDLELAFLHGVLVVNRVTGEETFYPLLAEQPDQEAIIWQQFLDLVHRYPQSPIFHFCAYEVQTAHRLGQRYGTPPPVIEALVARFVDLHDLVTNSVTLPVESYALKLIARWLGFRWRDQGVDGAQAIIWYNRWRETGDHTYLDAIVRYNEDDCRATYVVKDWLVRECLNQTECQEASG
ncbi:TM0106 family RecB-like putative nuclease [Leptolyngbya sp. FACHB-261]|uniref:TM0106 family RecB-like putative nuclease n=1 Tax=Leptolyngbya sp. FACHB-261 TaxID=2692806 RepID=UPI001687BBD8|nr:TM0106 family RecB-like putative nuclease [Leptolyngbya sp. FACHB-261]MBD2102008.1 TM0106 family RecB-like putative nuclease [Leptolyngbya sp. FACHB-261]